LHQCIPADDGTADYQTRSVLFPIAAVKAASESHTDAAVGYLHVSFPANFLMLIDCYLKQLTVQILSLWQILAPQLFDGLSKYLMAC
jgi:hypothetical protein